MSTTIRTSTARVTAAAVALTVGVWLATVAAVSIEPSTHGIDVAAGAGTFRDHCGACHIVEKGVSTHHGPNLYDFGKLAGTRKPGLTAAQYVLESIVDPEAFVAPGNHRGMPRNLASRLSSQQLRDVIAYVAGQGATPDYREIVALPIPDRPADVQQRIVSRDQMELAEHVLHERGACLQCHSLYRNAEYQVFAPALFGIGLSDEGLVRESIVDPNKVIAPRHRGVIVSLANGQTVTGKLIARDSEQLTLVTRGEQNRLISRRIMMSEVDHEDGQPLIKSAALSLMPTGFDQLLSPAELNAVITLIRQLN